MKTLVGKEKINQSVRKKTVNRKSERKTNYGIDNKKIMLEKYNHNTRQKSETREEVEETGGGSDQLKGWEGRKRQKGREEWRE